LEETDTARTLKTESPTNPPNASASSQRRDMVRLVFDSWPACSAVTSSSDIVTVHCRGDSTPWIDSGKVKLWQ